LEGKLRLLEGTVGPAAIRELTYPRSVKTMRVNFFVIICCLIRLMISAAKLGGLKQKINGEEDQLW
jgi:hypothetical protein